MRYASAMSAHVLGLCSAVVAYALTTLGAVLMIGVPGLFVGAGLAAVGAVLLIDGERLSE